MIDGASVFGVRDAYSSQVQDALEHLYDYVYLQNHPLSRRLVPNTCGWNRGAALHRLLIETIEHLRPPADTPTHSALWRRHRHAFSRYVEGRTVAHIAEELGVSDRQARRDNNDALTAIVGLLGPPVTPTSRGGTTGQLPAGDDSGGVVASADLDDELTRLAATGAPTATDLNDVMAGILSTISRLTEIRGIRLVVNVPSDVPPVSVERTALRQVLLSELLWLIDVVRPGSEIPIEVHRTPDASSITIAVTIQPDIAVPGVADSERLEIGARLATLHGATLVRELEGGNLHVSLIAPLLRLPTVLLVDDNPGMRRLMRRFLSGSPITVMEANSASEALRCAQDAQPDVITADVMMPTTDGWELLQGLRQHPRTRHIPVVVCSVLKERELAMSLGAAGFIAKPITREALTQVLAELGLPTAG